MAARSVGFVAGRAIVALAALFVCCGGPLAGHYAGREWLGKNAPSSEVVVLPGLHLMHWESPERVNAAVETFLNKLD